MKNNFLIIIVILLFNSCSENYIPKSYGYYRLEFPNNEYKETNFKNFSFQKSIYSEIIIGDNNFFNIKYNKMNATIYCTYKKVNRNINQILEDVEKFTYKHTIKADAINEKLFENKERGNFGVVNNIEGNSATNIQFYITDKKENILSGSLYFYCSPNYDSLLPAIKYIEKDIQTLMETLRWK